MMPPEGVPYLIAFAILKYKKGGSISYKYLTLKSRWEGNALDKIQRFLSVVYSNCIIGRVTV